MGRSLSWYQAAQSLVQLPLLRSSAILDLHCFTVSNNELPDKVICKVFSVVTRVQG